MLKILCLVLMILLILSYYSYSSWNWLMVITTCCHGHILFLVQRRITEWLAYVYTQSAATLIRWFLIKSYTILHSDDMCTYYMYIINRVVHVHIHHISGISVLSSLVAGIIAYTASDWPCTSWCVVALLGTQRTADILLCIWTNTITTTGRVRCDHLVSACFELYRACSKLYSCMHSVCPYTDSRIYRDYIVVSVSWTVCTLNIRIEYCMIHQLSRTLNRSTPFS